VLLHCYSFILLLVDIAYPEGYAEKLFTKRKRTMKENHTYLKTFDRVIITGASSGIGSSIIELILKVNPNVRICNLSRTRPERFADVSNFFHISCDLRSAEETTGAITALRDWLKVKESNSRLMLVNNSGFGTYGVFPTPDTERNVDMLQVNVCAPVRLTGELSSELIASQGAVMNIASTAAFQPTPYLCTYGASKSFLQHWSLGLAEEWKEKGVRVLAVCPGPTATKFFSEAGFKKSPLKKGTGMTAEQVAVISLRALDKGKTLVTCGWINRFLASFTAKLPKVCAARVTAVIMRKLRLERHQ